MTVVGQCSALHSNDVLHICCMWWYLSSWGLAPCKHWPQPWMSVPNTSFVWTRVMIRSLSVYGVMHGELQVWYTSKIMHSKNKNKKKATFAVVLLHSQVIKALLCHRRSAKSTTRKSWRTCRATRHATWRRWRPSSSRRRRRRGRGWASWSRLSSPSTDTWTSPTTRGEQRRVHRVFLKNHCASFRHHSSQDGEKLSTKSMNIICKKVMNEWTLYNFPFLNFDTIPNV